MFWHSLNEHCLSHMAVCWTCRKLAVQCWNSFFWAFALLSHCLFWIMLLPLLLWGWHLCNVVNCALDANVSAMQNDCDHIDAWNKCICSNVSRLSGFSCRNNAKASIETLDCSNMDFCFFWQLAQCKPVQMLTTFCDQVWKCQNNHWELNLSWNGKFDNVKTTTSSWTFHETAN